MALHMDRICVSRAVANREYSPNYGESKSIAFLKYSVQRFVYPGAHLVRIGDRLGLRHVARR